MKTNTRPFVKKFPNTGRFQPCVCNSLSRSVMVVSSTLIGSCIHAKKAVIGCPGVFLKHAGRKTKTPTPPRRSGRKPPTTRVEHGTLPVRGERSHASQPLRHGGLFGIALFHPPSEPLPDWPRNPMECARVGMRASRVSGNLANPRVYRWPYAPE